MNMNDRFSRSAPPSARSSGRLFWRGLFRTAIPCLLLSAACKILEEDISDRRVRIIGPAEYAEVRAGAVTFRWEALPGASGYILSVASPSFGDGCLTADTTLYADTLGSRRYGCSIPLAEGAYEWSVAAFNSGYQTCAEVRHLTVLPAAEPSDGQPNPTQAARP